MFGPERVLRGGLRVYSTYEPLLQRAAEQAVRTRVAEIAKARRRAQDLQGSLVAIDPASGDVLALVGGRDFGESSFNRATQARRQAGSAFKPIIYAAALERGYAPGSVLTDLDTPIYASGRMWLPVGEHEASQYTLRKALKVSSNRAAAQLLQHVGVGTAVDYAHRFGIDSDLPSVPSLALGTGEVTLLELTAAYGVFANQGLLAAPRLVSRVEDAEGRVIWSAPITTTRAISQTTAFLMSSMLADVVSSGTATGARAAGFKLPAGGKTGTTDDYADAWFVGYTPHLVAGVWFGFDTPAPIMSRGFASTVAVPAWARFMKAATMGARPDWYAGAGRRGESGDLPADWRSSNRRVPTRHPPEHGPGGRRRCVGKPRTRFVAVSGCVAAKPAARAERLRGLLSAWRDLGRAVPAARHPSRTRAFERGSRFVSTSSDRD